MGLSLKLDIDTFEGPSQSVYCRIDQLVIQKTTNRIIISMCYFTNPDKTQPNDQLPYTVLHYLNNEDEPVETKLPSTLKVNLGETTIMKEPIYKKEKVKEQVPYVSFDENGDELTKYREVEVEKNIKVGEEKTEITIPIYDAIQKDIFGYCYNKIKQELKKAFPQAEVIDN